MCYDLIRLLYQVILFLTVKNKVKYKLCSNVVISEILWVILHNINKKKNIEEV